MRDFLRLMVLGATVRRAIRVALVVAPILVIINQGDVLLSGSTITPRLAFKIALTFVVPYLVSSYSSARALKDRRE